MSIFYGKTSQEAIEAGLKELNLSEEDVEIKVIEEATKGFLGIGSKQAKVEIIEKKTDGKRAVEFLDGLFELMNATVKCNIEEENEKIIINLITDNSSSIIGYRGEVLDSLQCLAGAVANIGREDYRRVVVDCEGYRVKREETLISLANKLADKAVRTGRKVCLEPMNPYERRILHSALADSKDVKTQSEGKEPNRFVAIIPNNMKPYSGERKGYDGYKKDGYKGKSNYDKNSEGGYRNNRRDRNSAPRQPRPKTTGFGTFLGNSLKNSEED